MEIILSSTRAGQSMREDFTGEMAFKMSLEGWVEDNPGAQGCCRQRECVQRQGSRQPYGVFGDC